MLYVKPMLAQKMNKRKTLDDYTNERWGMQLKIDGHRRLTWVRDGIVSAYSRLLNPVAWPQHIVQRLSTLPNGLYDAEAFILGGQATDVKRLDLQDKLHCAVFDIIMRHNEEVDACYSDRHDWLQEQIPTRGHGDNLPAVHVPELYTVGQDGIDAFLSQDLEGVVLKRLASSYQAGRRSPDWVKVKRSSFADVTLIGFKAGLLGEHSILQGVDSCGVYVDVKARNDTWRKHFGIYTDRFIGMTLRIRYETRATAGGYRHPVAIGFVNLPDELPREMGV